MSKNDQLVKMAALRLKSVSLRIMFRQGAAQYLGIPLELSDAEAMDVLARAIASLEGKL